MINFITKYNIGESIYHNSLESERGLIIDISYKVSTKEITYLVAIGFNNEVWAFERELTKDKILV